MLRGYEDNSTETSRTMRAMSSEARRRRVVAAAACALVLASCTSASGVSTDEANIDGSRPPVVTPPTSEPESTTPSTASDGTAGPENTAPEPTDVASETAPPTTEDGEQVATPIPGSPGTSIDWQRIDDHLQQGTLNVPVDYDDPSAGNFRLFMVRRLANDQDNKIGTLLINPGGPGASGATFAAGADFVFDKALLDRFDILGWDPRGTSYTQPAIDCIEDYDHYYAGYDITPDTPEEHQQIIDLAKDFEDRCVRKNEAIIQHIGTNDSARDMDSIRRALGEDKISYFGFSYGSELGATWATMFPTTVRAAVLDGAVDPNADQLESERQQNQGFEHTLGLYLDDCAKDSECPFYNEGFTREAFDELMANLDEHPIPTKDGRPDLTRGMALQGVAMAMYDDSLWDQLSDALADAQRGDGAGLLTLWDTYYNRTPEGTWPNFLEAFQVISCMDSADRPTIEQEDANAAEISRLAPRFAPATVGDYACTWFPPSEHPRIPITGAGAGPIVVIGTTGDPATPLASTEAMAAALEDGRLIIVTADKHTGYGENSCVDDVVHAYLIDLEVPPERTQC
jgi:pimeloyl-ACP methyl ester carboxylesterase